MGGGRVILPNWDKIKRCSIWPVLGVIECNSCDSCVQCWGEETILPDGSNAALKKLLVAVEEVKDD